MRRFPVYLNYDFTKTPIGFVNIHDETHEDIEGIIRDGAIVPHLVKKEGEEEFQVKSFGLVKRTEVNTGPLE
jgi:hypothetical protein